MKEQEFIYHITSEKEWKEAQQTGWYEAPSLKVEGFIHCSTETQVEGVLQRYYAGKTNLVKLVIDPLHLSYPLKYERSPSVNELFPHVYGVINVDAVKNVVYL
jgi:uncharacterized protein (DUF952 family)